jgi:hypothetical protein
MEMEILLVILMGSLSLAGGILDTLLLASRKTKSKVKRQVASGFFAYLGSYAILSSHGQYLDGNHGGSDNRSTWYALHCGYQYRKPTGRVSNFITPLGAFFWPLALIDAQLIHPEKDI